MSISIADIVRRMAAAGAPAEAIAIAIDAIEQTKQEFEAAEEARKTGQRNRKRKSRDSHGTVTGQSMTVTDQSRDNPLPPVPSSSSPPYPPNNYTPDPPTPVSNTSCSQGSRAATRPIGSEESGSPSEERASNSESNRTASPAAKSAVDKAFDEFWREYPKRDGRSPKDPAARKFLAAIKSGVPASTIIDGAKRYRAECDERKLTGTPMVAQAVTWLNQRSWSDYANAAQAPPGQLLEERPGRPEGMPISAWNKFGQHWTPETPGQIRPDQWEAWKRERANGQTGSPESAPVAGSCDGVGQAERQLL